MAWGFLARMREKWPDLPLIVTSIYEESAGRVGTRRGTFFCPSRSSRQVLLRELRRLTAHTGTRRLLLVDDNDVARYILRELLDQPWLEIREASNGTEAMAATQREIARMHRSWTC